MEHKFLLFGNKFARTPALVLVGVRRLPDALESHGHFVWTGCPPGELCELIPDPARPGRVVYKPGGLRLRVDALEHSPFFFERRTWSLNNEPGN